MTVQDPKLTVGRVARDVIERRQLEDWLIAPSVARRAVGRTNHFEDDQLLFLG